MASKRAKSKTRAKSKPKTKKAAAARSTPRAQPKPTARAVPRKKRKAIAKPKPVKRGASLSRRRGVRALSKSRRRSVRKSKPRPIDTKFITPTPRGRENWESLTEKQQMAAVAWAATYIRKRFEKAYRGEFGRGIVGFGHGARELQKGVTKRRYRKQPVLIILVKKGFAQSWRAQGRGRYPERVQLTVPVEPAEEKRRKTKKPVEPDWFYSNAPVSKAKRKKKPRRIVLAIPVDVTAHVVGDASSAILNVQDQRLLVTGKHSTPHAGTACTRVRIRGQTTPAVMSCHHVVWNSKDRPKVAEDRTARIFSAKVNSTVKTVPAVAEIGEPWGPSLAKTGIDAGLVWLNQTGIDTVIRPAYWRVQPLGFLASADAWAKFASPNMTGFKLYPWGSQGVISLTYRKAHAPELIDYGAGALVNVAEAFLFTPSRNTIGGYSGSPVVYRASKGDVLIGMHIAGSAGTSFVLPAYQFMSPGTVHKDGLELDI